MSPVKQLACAAALTAIALAMSSDASAHPVPFSFVDVRIEKNALNVILVAHIFDLAHDLNLTPQEELLKADVVRQRAAAMEAMLTPRFSIAADGQRLTPTWSSPPDILAERQ